MKRPEGGGGLVCTAEALEAAFAWMEARAGSLGIDPAAVAGRAAVTAFLDDVEDASSPFASGWRRDVFGMEMASRFGIG